MQFWCQGDIFGCAEPILSNSITVLGFAKIWQHDTCLQRISPSRMSTRNSQWWGFCCHNCAVSSFSFLTCCISIHNHGWNRCRFQYFYMKMDMNCKGKFFDWIIHYQQIHVDNVFVDNVLSTNTLSTCCSALHCYPIQKPCKELQIICKWKKIKLFKWSQSVKQGCIFLL